LLLTGIGLAALDRVGVAMLLISMAYGMFTGGRVWPGGWPHWHFPQGGGAHAQAGQTTRVATDWIEMELDHDTGEMRGRALKGSYMGKSLDALSDDQSIAFYSEAAASDSETARLLEAYLDRRLGADWRNRASKQEQWRGHSKSASAMSRDEAYRVLGLQPGASEDEIRAAHRRLMLNLHPDCGGTDYLAAKINEAKDVLLSA
jgi:DnaJ-domain-containing protein 1